MPLGKESRAFGCQGHVPWADVALAVASQCFPAFAKLNLRMAGLATVCPPTLGLVAAFLDYQSAVSLELVNRYFREKMKKSRYWWDVAERLGVFCCVRRPRKRVRHSILQSTFSTSPKLAVQQHIQALRHHTDIVIRKVISLAVRGSHFSHLDLRRLRKIIKPFRPILPNRIFKLASYSSLLIATCQARGTSERKIFSMVKYLVTEQGCDVNVYSSDMNAASLPPLYYAVAKGYPMLTAFLLNHGADPTLKCYGGFWVNRKLIRGTWDALGWGRVVLSQLSKDKGSGEKNAYRSLRRCITLLERNIEARSTNNKY
ncbi:hypothetical protein AAMO2058_000094900 [Amorphochlora amoebiformis]